MIALDTDVLIDLLGDDPRADATEAALRLALTNGPVVVCDVVLSKVTAGLGSGSEILDVLEDMGIRFFGGRRARCGALRRDAAQVQPAHACGRQVADHAPHRA